MPILTALFSAGLAMVLDRYVKVMGLHAQTPDAPFRRQSVWDGWRNRLT